MGRRRRIAVALVALHVLVPLVTIARPGFGRDQTTLHSDAGRYFEIATAPGVPGRDFRAEYPPLAVLGMRAIAGHDVHDLSVHLALLEWAADAAIALLLPLVAGEDAALVYLALSALFLPFLLGVFDLVVVALALGAVALSARRARAGGALLAASTFVKPFGVLALPALGAPMMGRWRAHGAPEERITRRRGIGAAVAVLVGGGAAWIAWSGLRGPLDVATFRGSRGWQVESTPGVLLAVVDRARGRMEQGAMRVGAPPSWLGALLAIGTLVAVAWWWRRALGRDAVRIEVATLGAFAIWFLGTTLLSPQFFAWFLPLVALAFTSGARRTATAGAVVVALTIARLANHMADSAPIRLLVLLRVVALVALLVVANRELTDNPAPAEAAEPLAVAP